MIVERAAAKLNLALHVTGRRADGYHLLDSIVVFAEVGDVLTLRPGPLSLEVTGPFGAGLGGEDDLCLRAARLVGAEAEITLEKNLPVASGIGGGSADAAAVLRGLARMGAALPDDVARLGADLPVCLTSRPARMRGIGEVLDPLPPLPDLSLVLVNPGVAVPTPAVFAALQSRENPPLPKPDWRDRASLMAYLQACRNDLEPPAIAVAPVIAEALDALRREGAELARMSGSGATCFGIYPDDAAAARAAAALSVRGWWAVATGLAPAPAPG
ncbi:MAG: 4-(cytidine 5'-diphospho)-2-C-methyl-D-erythritol kinase [Paracoccus sp. (in: a-proteobacteria)]|nr:4-(cytidine 5'-diphospho)-2-C-methyl-D-erythritol kinase [Paracoccus sp. (in: a-proteobacteria)]